jgi:AbrB family looped-hinge helix DNA binding protein
MRSSNQPTKVVRALRSGQITIPAEFRRRLGIDDKTLLRLTLEDGELRISPVRIVESAGERDWLDALYEAYAPIREEVLARGIPSEEIYADIDVAIAEVRAEQLASRA